jgi:tetratricopeptide (TPR) repeat protein
MTRLRIAILQSLFLIAASLIPTAILAQGGARFGLEIEVQIRMANGHPGPRGVHVILDSAEGGSEGDCQTRDGGKCELRPTTAGVYVVRVNEQGYLPASARVELTAITRQMVTLELKPVDGGPQPTKSDPDAAPMISAAEANLPPKAHAELLKGQQAIEAKKIDEAIGHLKKSISIYGTYPQSHLLLGSAYLEQKNWKGAEASLEKAVELDPKLSDAYLELGAVYNQTKEYPKAEAALNKGLELSPDAAGGHYELAKTYWAMGRWQDAAPHAQTAVTKMPSLAAPHVLLGNILLKKNELDGALHEYQEYLRLDPEGSMAAGTREMVEKIKKALEKK